MCDKLKAFTDKPYAGHSAFNRVCLLFLASRPNALRLITRFVKKNMKDVTSNGGKALAFNRRSINLLAGHCAFMRIMACKGLENHGTSQGVFNMISIAIASHIFMCSLQS